MGGGVVALFVVGEEGSRGLFVAVGEALEFRDSSFLAVSTVSGRPWSWSDPVVGLVVDGTDADCRRVG